MYRHGGIDQWLETKEVSIPIDSEMSGQVNISALVGYRVRWARDMYARCECREQRGRKRKFSIAPKVARRGAIHSGCFGGGIHPGLLRSRAVRCILP